MSHIPNPYPKRVSFADESSNPDASLRAVPLVRSSDIHFDTSAQHDISNGTLLASPDAQYYSVNLDLSPQLQDVQQHQSQQHIPPIDAAQKMPRYSWDQERSITGFGAAFDEIAGAAKQSQWQIVRNTRQVSDGSVHSMASQHSAASYAPSQASSYSALSLASQNAAASSHQFLSPCRIMQRIVSHLLGLTLFELLFGRWNGTTRFEMILNAEVPNSSSTQSPRRLYKGVASLRTHATMTPLYHPKTLFAFFNRLSPFQYIILLLHAMQLGTIIIFCLAFAWMHFRGAAQLTQPISDGYLHEWMFGLFSQNIYFTLNIILLKCFEIIFLWSSMFWENPVQMFVGYFMSGMCLVVQSALFYLVQRSASGSAASATQSARSWMALGVLITIVLSALVNIPLGLRMAFSFGRRMFSIVGVSKLNILLFLNDQYVISVLLGDLQFLMSSVLLIIFCFNFPWYIYLCLLAYAYLSIVLTPLFISILYRLEYRLLSILYCLYQSVLPAFLIYLIVGLITRHGLMQMRTLNGHTDESATTHSTPSDLIVWEISHLVIVAGGACLWRLCGLFWCVLSVVFLYGHKRRKLDYRRLMSQVGREVY